MTIELSTRWGRWVFLRRRPRMRKMFARVRPFMSSSCLAGCWDESNPNKSFGSFESFESFGSFGTSSFGSFVVRIVPRSDRARSPGRTLEPSERFKANDSNDPNDFERSERSDGSEGAKERG